MHTNKNVWSFSLYLSSFHPTVTNCLPFFCSCILSWKKLLCCLQNVPINSEKACPPAPTIWVLGVRVYNLLPVALRIKKTTISALTRKENHFSVWMVKDVTDMQSNLTTENKPIPITMISVLVLCISSKSTAVGYLECNLMEYRHS
jgi:hypothetical protein